MTTIENIKRLYPQIMDKSALQMLVADDLNLQSNTLRSHWFKGVWAIPKKYQNRVVELLQNTIRQQIAKQQQLIK